MLSITKLKIASSIATQLIEDGMLWGDELEWYVKTSACDETTFKDDDEYLKFENVVLDLIESRMDRGNSKSTKTKRKLFERYGQPVLIKNINTGEIKEYKNRKELAEEHDICYSAIGNYITNKILFKRKYIICNKSNPDFEIKEKKRNYTSSKEVKLKNIKTNKIKTFKSATLAAEYIGVSVSTITTARKRNSRIRRIWEVIY